VFALLVRDARQCKAFESIIQCMELLVIALGETSFAFGSRVLTPAGYRFDPGGNTPKAPQLLGTPQQLAAHQLDKEDTERTAILRYTLRGQASC